MTVNITIIALFVRVMETHAKGGTIGIAQLKAESAQKVPLRFRAELVGQGNIHCPAHAGIPTLLGLLARAASSPGAIFGPMICHSITSCLCLDQSCFSPLRLFVKLQRVS